MRIVTAALALLPTVALAHPGDHGMSATAFIAHFLSQPDHLPLVAAVVIGGFWLAARLQRKD